MKGRGERRGRAGTAPETTLRAGSVAQIAYSGSKCGAGVKAWRCGTPWREEVFRLAVSGPRLAVRLHDRRYSRGQITLVAAAISSKPHFLFIIIIILEMNNLV